MRRPFMTIGVLAGLATFIALGWSYLNNSIQAQKLSTSNVIPLGPSTNNVAASTGAQTPPPVQPPASPTGLRVSEGAYHVSLSWNASSGATEYVVYEASTNNFAVAKVVVQTPDTSATVQSLAPTTTYYFWVTARNSGGVSKPIQGTRVTTYMGWSNIQAAYADSIVRVSTYTTALGVFGSGVSGTGWVAPGGYIVTNCHVIRNANYVIDVWLHNDGSAQFAGQKFHASVVYEDKANDLVLLKLENPPSYLTPLVIGGAAGVGEPVGTMGHPGGQQLVFTNGVIQGTGVTENVTNYGTLDNMTLTNVPSVRGNSGSPVFNPWGQVVGIMESAGNHDGNVSYFVPVQYLQQWGISGKSTDGVQIFPVN